MRLKYIVLFLSLIVVANAGKVTWGADGKPNIELSGKPVKGCGQGGLSSLLKDTNTTKKKCD
jgi:hypothetical protein